MLTKEVREWIKKVERGEYSPQDAIETLVGFSKYLTKEELKILKSKIQMQ